MDKLDNFEYIRVSFKEDYNPKKGEINLYIDGKTKKIDTTEDVVMKSKGDTVSEKIAFIKTILIDNKDRLKPIAEYFVYDITSTKIKENYYELTNSYDLIQITESKFYKFK